MRRSSRILCVLVVAVALTAAAASTEARGLRGGLGLGGSMRLGGGMHFGGRPFTGGPRGIFRPGVGVGVGTGIRPGFARRGLGRFARGRGFGGYGLGGYGFGSYGFGGPDLPLGGGDLPPVDAGGYGGPPSPDVIPVVRPPPVCPLIISVGRGLRHPVHTKVVYGRQPACRR